MKGIMTYYSRAIYARMTNDVGGAIAIYARPVLGSDSCIAGKRIHLGHRHIGNNGKLHHTGYMQNDRKGTTTVGGYYKRHAVRGDTMMTVQRPVEDNGTLSWADYTIATIEQQVKTQQRAGKSYLHYPIEPHDDIPEVVAMLQVSGYMVRQTQGSDEGFPVIWLEILW